MEETPMHVNKQIAKSNSQTKTLFPIMSILRMHSIRRYHPKTSEFEYNNPFRSPSTQECSQGNSELTGYRVSWCVG